MHPEAVAARNTSSNEDMRKGREKSRKSSNMAWVSRGRPGFNSMQDEVGTPAANRALDRHFSALISHTCTFYVYFGYTTMPMDRFSSSCGP
jgi:hypothetical protein